MVTSQAKLSVNPLSGSNFSPQLDEGLNISLRCEQFHARSLLVSARWDKRCSEIQIILSGMACPIYWF